jgi:hypothetical protein
VCLLASAAPLAATGSVAPAGACVYVGLTGAVLVVGCVLVLSVAVCVCIPASVCQVKDVNGGAACHADWGCNCKYLCPSIGTAQQDLPRSSTVCTACRLLVCMCATSPRPYQWHCWQTGAGCPRLETGVMCMVCCVRKLTTSLCVLCCYLG